MGTLSIILVITALFGTVAYFAVRLWKASTDPKWRKDTRQGRLIVMASPVVLGGVLGLIFGKGAWWALSGGDSLPLSFALLLGLVGGMCATQIHRAVRAVWGKAVEALPVGGDDGE
jgi:hypothetical protein